MTIRLSESRLARSGRRGLVILLAAISFGAAGCATESAAYRNQRTFDDPKTAAETLVAAAEDDDVATLKAIFGPDGDAVLSSGDPVMDERQREVFAVAAAQGWSLEKLDGGSRELVVGDEAWPFPVPLVKDSRGWWFDTAAGADEILARRIGRNELSVIGVLHAYVFAQEDYAGSGHDGHPAGRYAQQVRSTPGRHDGLYWSPDAAGDEGLSPLSVLAADAADEGYSDEARDSPTPFHGYYFRILTGQGAHAPGGAMSYLADDAMTGGFAAIAWPAEYYNSGIMTFIVGADGIVYESDLGEDTATLASKIESYDPGENWHPAE